MRIRWRLTWYGIGFTALVLVAIIVLLSALIATSAASDQEELLSGMADDAAAGLSAGAIEASVPPVPPGVPDAATSDQPFLTVYDLSGVVLYATGTVNGNPLELPGSVVDEAVATGIASASFSGVRSEVRAWANLSGDSGVVAASQSERVVADQLLGARWFIGLFGVIALIAAGIGAWFMAGRALTPLRVLAETTDRIGKTGDLSARLREVKQDDEVGALASSFNEMIDGLEAARADRDSTIEAQKRFVADASHELRSPLTSIRANVGFLIEHDNASTHDRDAAMTDIRSEARRMSGLIDEMLMLARADNLASGSVKEEVVDLVAIVQSVVGRARRLTISTAVDVPDRADVTGHPDELAEMLWILIDNADKHGGDAVTIAVGVGGEGVVLTVADNGPGVPDADLDSVFDRFHRSDEQRSGTGYGLGLAIARAIVHRHDGSIEVANASAGGAVFTVVLPISGS